jgi:hypothetical protein
MREFLKMIKVIEKDGTERDMTDQEVDDMVASLEAVEAREDDWGAVQALEDMIPGLEIESFAGYCPVQGYGTLDGVGFYFRSRWDTATLSVGDYESEEEEAANYWKPKQYAAMRVTEDEYAAGWLKPAEVMVIFPELVKRLQFQAPEDGEERLQNFCDQVKEIADRMKENNADDAAGVEG